MLVVGNVIGSGIFLTTGGMAAHIPSASLLLLAWTLGGVLTIAGGLTYAEMGAMFPRSGGVYVFLREAYGELPAFLYGWVALLVVISGGIAGVAVGFAEYLSFFIPAFSTTTVLVALPTPWGAFNISPGQVVAAVSLAVLGAINYVGVRSGNMVNVVLTIAKVAGLAALPIMAILAANVQPAFTPIVPAVIARPLASFGIAMIAVLWTYEAWYFMTYAAGEIKDPQRNVPRALFIGVLTLMAIYLVVNLAYLYALSIDEMRGVTRVAEKAATALVGPGGASFVALTVVVSTFGCNAAGILARLAHLVRNGDRRRFPAGSEPCPPALPDAARRHRRADHLVDDPDTDRHLRAAVHLRHVLVDSVQRRGWAGAVPPAAAPTRGCPAVPCLGLSDRSARVRPRLDRICPQHAVRETGRIAGRPRPARPRRAGLPHVEKGP